MLFKMILFLTLLTQVGFAESLPSNGQIIRDAAQDVGVPPDLLSAICWAESNHVVTVTPADGGRDNHAFGVCQILYNTAVEYGFPEDQDCADTKRYNTCALVVPYASAYYAAKYLKYQLKRYKGSWINAIAAYNAGSVKICTRGWVYYKGKPLHQCRIGSLLNQVYVDRVLKALSEKR